MARFLSPLSNPIESAVDTYAKLSGVFNDQDRLEIAKQDAADRRQESYRRREMETMKLDEAKADKPVKDLERANRRAQAVYGPSISGILSRLQPGQPVDMSDEEAAALVHFGENTGIFGKDPKSKIEKAVAVNNMAAQMQQVKGAFQQLAQRGELADHRLTREQAPELFDNIDKVPEIRRLFGTDKDITGFLIAKDGSITATVKDGDKETPVTEPGQDGYHVFKSVPVSKVQDTMNHFAKFSSLTIAAASQLGMDEKKIEAVKKHYEAFDQLHARHDTMDEFDDWLKDNEDTTVAKKWIQLQKIAADKGLNESDTEKIAKDIIHEKTGKASKLMKVSSGDHEELVDPDAEGGPKTVWRGDPKKKETDELTMEIKRDRLDRSREERDRKKKDDYDKRVKEESAIIQKTEEGKGLSPEEVETRARGIVDAREKREKPPEPDKGQKNVTNLTKWMKGLKKEGWLTGTDIQGSIQGAVDDGHNLNDLRIAAGKLPEDDKKQQILKAIDKVSGPVEKKNAATSGQKRSNMEFSDMPPANQHSGKILRDNETGKRYKSDGKSWKPLS